MFFGWWIVISCFVLGFYVSSTVFYGFTAFFEPIVGEFGWSHTAVSLAVSIRGLEIGLFAPVVGFLVDRFGSRKLIFSGVLTAGAGFILLGLSQTITIFYAAILLIGFGAGGCAGLVTNTIIANWFRRDLGKALAVMTSGFGAGGLLIPLIVWLIDGYGWRTAMFCSGIGMWILGIPLSFVMRHTPEEYGCLPDGGACKAGDAQREVLQLPEVDFREAVWKKSFVFLTLAEIIRMMVVYAVMTHIMPYLSTVGMGRTAAGVVTAAIPIISIPGRLGFGWLSDSFSKKKVMICVYLITIAGLLGLLYADRGWPIYFFLLLFAPGMGGGVVLRAAIIQERFGRRSFGKLLGVHMGIASIGGVVGPTLVGWFFDTWRSYQISWVFFLVCMAFSADLILRIESEKET
jgi:sugar phosphate permease